MKRKQCPGCGLGFTKGGRSAQVLFGDGSMREAEVCDTCGGKALTIVPVGSGLQTRSVLAPYAKHLRKLALAYPDSDRAEGLLQTAGILESGRAVALDDVRAAAPPKRTEPRKVPEILGMTTGPMNGSPEPKRSIIANGRIATSGGPTKSASKMLAVLAQRNIATSRSQLAILAGYSGTSGGFGSALALMRANAWVLEDGGRFILSDSGRAIAPKMPALPKGSDLLDYWCERVGPCATAILQAFVHDYPDEVPRDELAQRAGYSSTSGGFGSALAVLRALDLAVGYRASKELIDAMGLR